MSGLKMRTEKGVTFVEVAGKRIDTGAGRQGIREAMEIISTQLFMAVIRGDKVFTVIADNAVKSLVPDSADKKSVTYTVGEEEHISDRVIHITA